MFQKREEKYYFKEFLHVSPQRVLGNRHQVLTTLQKCLEFLYGLCPPPFRGKFPKRQRLTHCWSAIHCKDPTFSFILWEAHAGVSKECFAWNLPFDYYGFGDFLKRETWQGRWALFRECNPHSPSCWQEKAMFCLSKKFLSYNQGMKAVKSKHPPQTAELKHPAADC